MTDMCSLSPMQENDREILDFANLEALPIRFSKIRYNTCGSKVRNVLEIKFSESSIILYGSANFVRSSIISVYSVGKSTCCLLYTSNLRGGYMLQKDQIYINNSVEAMMDEKRRELMGDVALILFPEEK